MKNETGNTISTSVAEYKIMKIKEFSVKLREHTEINIDTVYDDIADEIDSIIGEQPTPSAK